MFRTYLGTRSGIYRFDAKGLTHLGLAEYRFWAIYAYNESSDHSPEHDTILAGSYGQGIFRSTDGGAHWVPANEGLTATALRTILADPAHKGAILCGTEPARGFRSLDGGQSWQELTGIATLPTSAEWYLPYSPRAGAIRNFYSPPGQPNRLLGSVEVGGVLDSHDGGKTWTILDTFDDDIHYVTGHPEEPHVLWLALGLAILKSRPRVERSLLAGVARSDDWGKTWVKRLSGEYTRAVLIPPTHPHLVLAGPAQMVGAKGSIVVSEDGGETWFPADKGLEKPMIDMVELFVPAPDGSIWAICAQGRLLRAEPEEWHWYPVLAGAKETDICIESVSFVAT